MFKVHFRSRVGYAVCVSLTPGVRQLDEARVVLGPSVVHDDLLRLYDERDPIIGVPEEVARACPLLQEAHKSPVVVEVPSRSLNRYVRFVPKRRSDGKVEWESILDDTRLLSDWAAAGYPREWSPGKREEG